MEHLNALIKELFRVYPTTPILFHRVATKDAQLCDLLKSKDSELLLILLKFSYPKHFNKLEELDQRDSWR